MAIKQHSELTQYDTQEDLPTNEVYAQDNAVSEPDRAPEKQRLFNTPSSDPKTL